jgi:hypothetical protein
VSAANSRRAGVGRVGVVVVVVVVVVDEEKACPRFVRSRWAGASDALQDRTAWC